MIWFESPAGLKIYYHQKTKMSKPSRKTSVLSLCGAVSSALREHRNTCSFTLVKQAHVLRCRAGVKNTQTGDKLKKSLE